MRRLASACAGASAWYFVASKASAVQREAGAESVVNSFAEAAPLVDESGVAVVCACVPAALLERCKQTEAFRSLPARAGAGHAAEWRQSAYGRFHRVDFADDDVHAFEELELAFAPLVRLRGDAAARRRPPRIGRAHEPREGAARGEQLRAGDAGGGHVGRY